MDIKKLVSQVVAAFLLFTIISVILEKEYTKEVIFNKAVNGLIFGLIYGVFLWAQEKFKNRK
ncbi:hypothetical protein [Pareuzebyella sediminis]|uniref:hypothetical protein n=1 Tax=Pareuzebyella sediminis TaxID=2607998 RepID=UPI0011EE5C7E|nr:hypothetical protein [Pareuzebyella sediminis]